MQDSKAKKRWGGIMFFREQEEFGKVIEKCVEEEFLRGICEKYHYLPEDREQLRQTAVAMQSIIRKESFWQHGLKKGETLPDCVVISLGEGIDRLQDTYSEKGELTSAYMVEILAGEILLLTYTAYNAYMERTTDYHVARYFFPGSEKEYPMTMLPKMLAQMDAGIVCNESFCMMPKQSVAFFALLTKDRNIKCRGICVDCGRKDCPNSTHKERPLPYGYARILGKEFV